MKKCFEYGIGKHHSEIFEKPIRTQIDATKVILEIISIIFNKSEWDRESGKVCIYIDKMSRVFCFFKHKYFSIHFPFSIEKDSEGEIRIYDAVSDLTIDFRRLGLLKTILKEIDFEKKSIDQIIENAYYDVISEEYSDEEVEECLGILFRTLTIEYGYLRFDYDEENCDEIYHPLMHLDINFMDNVTYKIGVSDFKEEDFIDLVNVREKCYKIL